MKKYPKNITDALDKLMEYGADLTDYVIISQQSWANGYSIKDLLNSQELLEEKDKQIRQLRYNIVDICDKIFSKAVRKHKVYGKGLNKYVIFQDDLKEVIEEVRSKYL